MLERSCRRGSEVQRNRGEGEGGAGCEAFLRQRGGDRNVCLSRLFWGEVGLSSGRSVDRRRSAAGEVGLSRDRQKPRWGGRRRLRISSWPMDYGWDWGKDPCRFCAVGPTTGVRRVVALQDGPDEVGCHSVLCRSHFPLFLILASRKSLFSFPLLHLAKIKLKKQKYGSNEI